MSCARESRSFQVRSAGACRFVSAHDRFGKVCNFSGTCFVCRLIEASMTVAGSPLRRSGEARGSLFPTPISWRDSRLKSLPRSCRDRRRFPSCFAIELRSCGDVRAARHGLSAADREALVPVSMPPAAGRPARIGSAAAEEEAAVRNAWHRAARRWCFGRGPAPKCWRRKRRPRERGTVPRSSCSSQSSCPFERLAGPLLIGGRGRSTSGGHPAGPACADHQPGRLVQRSMRPAGCTRATDGRRRRSRPLCRSAEVVGESANSLTDFV